ncbi:MAG: hypothetical protein GY756_05250 [bacterium]|nr:hypothetical protein [bacterium]
MKKRVTVSFIICALVFILLLVINSSEDKSRSIPQKTTIKETEVFIDVIKDIKKENLPKKKKDPIPVKKSIKKETNSYKAVAKAIPAKIDTGSFPPLSANYRTYVGFKKYADKMNNLGAKFFILDNSSNKLLKIDFKKATLIPIEIKKLNYKFFSSKSRLITDEPALEKYVTIAKNKYHVDDPEIIMLIPKSIEYSVARQIYSKVPNIYSAASIKGEYRNINGHITLVINKIIFHNKTTTTNIIVKL